MRSSGFGSSGEPVSQANSPVLCTLNGTGMMSPLTPENTTVSVPVTLSFLAVTLDSEASHSHSPGLAEPLPVPESALGSLLAGRMSTEQTLSLRTVHVPHLPCWPICVPWEMASPRPAPRTSFLVSYLPYLLLPSRAPCRGRSWKAHSFHTGCQGPLGPLCFPQTPFLPAPACSPHHHFPQPQLTQLSMFVLNVLKLFLTNLSESSGDKHCVSSAYHEPASRGRGAS